jgi:hypothetical protein
MPPDRKKAMNTREKEEEKKRKEKSQSGVNN